LENGGTRIVTTRSKVKTADQQATPANRILTSDNADSVAIEETDFWWEMQSNRIGNLLAGDFEPSHKTHISVFCLDRQSPFY
jgi:hypothetical protein